MKSMPCALFFAFVFTILMSAAAYASNTYAVVTGTRVNVRSYGEISNNRLFQVDMGTKINVHGICGDFFRATILGTSDVYIAREFVRVTHTQGRVIVPFAQIYDLPREEGGEIISKIPMNATADIVSSFGGWYGIQFANATAFIEKTELRTSYFVELPVARIGFTLADEIIANAKNYLGTRYLWGGTTPNGFDCSGFMLYIFTQHGINLNRTSRGQATNGTFVERHELEPADLVFFGGGNHISHVGMYIGGGQFIHSSTTRTGGVIISSMSCSHNSRTYVTARRVI